MQDFYSSFLESSPCYLEGGEGALPTFFIPISIRIFSIDLKPARVGINGLI